MVARFGCIPVPITDFVLQPFEPELDWPSFSVPVAEAEVPRMHEILEAITEDKLKEMQVGRTRAANVCTMYFHPVWAYASI